MAREAASASPAQFADEPPPAVLSRLGVSGVRARREGEIDALFRAPVDGFPLPTMAWVALCADPPAQAVA